MCENAFSWVSAFMNGLSHDVSRKKAEGAEFGNAWLGPTLGRAKCGVCLCALLGA